MPSGEVWIGTRDAGLARVRDGRVVQVTEGLPDQKINCLVPDRANQLWIGTDSGVARWDGNRVTREGLPAPLAGVPVTTMITDRDANVWIATPRGLLRLNRQGQASLDPSSAQAGVTALFEDRDGNLWIGTPNGLERWRDGVFTAYAEVRTVAAGNAGPVFVDASDRVWFAPPTGGLYWMRNGRVGKVELSGLGKDIVYSIDGTGNDLWIGRQRGGLTQLRAHGDSFTAETLTQNDGLAQNYVYAVQRDRTDAIWAGTLSGGVSRFKDSVFTTYTTQDGLASNTVAAILNAADGTMWFATPNGASARSPRGWRRYSTADGLPSNEINTLFEDSDHIVWLGTTAGLALVHDNHVRSDVSLPEPLRASILGIAQDVKGWLWIATADRVLRVDRKGLLRGAPAESVLREYGAADGLLGIEGVKRHRSLTMDSHGRIWISTNGGVAMLDPVRVADRSGPALAHVEGVTADGVPVVGSGPLSIPPRRQRITLAFSGLSLSVPERVRFRYRLDGFDHDWSDAVSARQAVYTNLGPGPYRFRLIACNSDGAWNGDEATLAFTIAPALWQTWWFRGSIALVLSAGAWGAYRMRMRQVARQLNVRFEERLAERTRIARDLHDTLLQSFHGAVFRVQAAVNMLPDRPVEAKQRLEHAIDQAAQAVTDGRDAVQNLRSTASDPHDLAQAIGALGEELADAGVDDNPSPTAVDIAVTGTPQALHPVLRDDVYRIAGEALRNAFRHARSRRIDVEIRYEVKQFVVSVRDNGHGIDPALLDRQPAGHFGLSGMRERAELIGGHLEVWSEVGAGTEVDLTIPAAAAYAAPRARSRFRWPAGRTKMNA
jgi:signal transduction histidine kinase/ligand-binding sensor domain-containing protein